MSTVDFNTLIYTASKSLKNADLEVPAVSDDLNNILQDKVLHMIQHRNLFKQEMSIKSWFFNVLNKTFSTQSEQISSTSSIGSESISSSNANEVNEIHNVVKSMEERLMVPFVMHFQGFKFEEIAENLSLTIDEVQERIYSARMFMVNQISE